MSKPNWNLIYQHSLTAALALICEVLLTSLAQFQNPLLVLISGIVIYFILLAIVQAIWVRVDKWIRNNKHKIISWFFRPKFEYTAKFNDEGDLYICVKELRKHNSVHLQLDFKRLKVISGTDYERNSIVNASINSKGKQLYKADVMAKDERRFLISEKQNGKTYIHVPGDHYLLPLFSGKRHIIEFSETSSHKGRNFSGELRAVEFIFNEKNER